jgi:hypothetical protein
VYRRAPTRISMENPARKTMLAATHANPPHTSSR